MIPRLHFLSILSFLSLLFYHYAYAKDKPYCDPESAQSDNLRQCAYQSLDTTDKDLNIVYQRLIKQLSAPEQIQLKKSERLWIKRKEQDCYSPQALEGRETTTDIDCGTDKTTHRIAYLTMYEACYHSNSLPSMMRSCLSNYYKILDKELNKIYKKQ